MFLGEKGCPRRKEKAHSEEGKDKRKENPASRRKYGDKAERALTKERGHTLHPVKRSKKSLPQDTKLQKKRGLEEKSPQRGKLSQKKKK